VIFDKNPELPGKFKLLIENGLTVWRSSYKGKSYWAIIKDNLVWTLPDDYVNNLNYGQFTTILQSIITTPSV
jgi:hypothetical protein